MDFEKIIRDLIAHEHEEEWFEFKTNWYEPKEIGEYISAMSNSAALLGKSDAYFVWGIENNTHRIVGTEFDYHRDVKNEPLQHYLARQIKPDNGFSFHELTMDGERLVILVIPAAKNVPTAFDRERFIRIGSSKANLMDYPEREAQLFSVLTHGLPKIVNTKSEYQDLTFNKLFVYYEAKGAPISKRTFKRNLGLLTEDGSYNIMAQLLSDDSHIPIRFSLFNGKTKASTMYSVREFGNTCLLYSLDGVLNYGDILNIPQADERNRVVERKEVMLFNKDAYHEAVINVFVHNRWIDGNAPMFTGYQDRIEILSMGELPPDQNLEDFYAGISRPVNKKLADVFLQLHISERSGRGIPKIVSAYGRDHIHLNQDNICVEIPYDRLVISDALVNVPVDVQVESAENRGTESTGALADKRNAPVDVPVNAPVDELAEKEKIVLEFCKEPKGIWAIADELGYKDKRTVRKILSPLLMHGRIAMTTPDKPNSSKQKYITIR